MGITVRVHVTLVALVALVALSAADAGESAAAAVGWLAALFACIVAHELSHALVARSRGIDVHRIDLLALGGVSRLERLPERWRDEAAIAAAGPLTSAALGAAAFLVAGAAGLATLPPSLWDGPVVVRLGWANVMLAAFNLVPAFPLDGGRVLRALLERDRTRVEATRLAARASRVLAAGMIGAGVVWNVWLVLVGVFVMLAGSAEEAAVLVHAALGPTEAAALAEPCPLSFSAAVPVADAARQAAVLPQPAYPVVGPAGAAVGAVTAAELARAASARHPATAGDLASGSVVEAHASLEDVAQLIGAGPVVVVADGGATVGVITYELLRRHLDRRRHVLPTGAR